MLHGGREGRRYRPNRGSPGLHPTLSPERKPEPDMPGTLVIVESPAKAKTIEKYLGDDYAVRASFGHVRDLPKSQLGVDVEKDFGVTYEVPEDSKKHVAELKRAMKGASDLILATDYDREGEAIAFHVATLLGLDPRETKRIALTESPRAACNPSPSG